ncbi:NADH-ubiquinone oxidoreductase chain M [Alloactinosynnema sp. L-07]|uniref:hypothetical protein n=1 Tax=Alloactinosynnema sp. L-07 TaxID=1653480 RepID=UPI00065EF190|nr:hypothetical protein [Alloactinosynnema sp. L-07]CRK59653.1 NADH-ubiquinone oxidoreductase chain M [Alloactinosynnema sp. L-07]
MVSLTGLAAVAAWTITGMAVGRIAEPRAARRAAVWCATGVLAFAVAEWVVAAPARSTVVAVWAGVQVGAGSPGTALAAVCLCGLLVMAMASVVDHAPAVLGRVCLLFAIACGYVAMTHPLADLALWILAMAVAWRWVRGPVYLLAQLAGAVGLVWGIGIGGFARSAVWFARAPMGVLVGLSMVPLSSAPISGSLRVAAAVVAVCAAVYAVVQDDARRMLGGLMVSLNGFLLTGGAWQVLAVACAGLGMTLAAVEARRGPLSLSTPSGSLTETPRLATALLVFGLGAVGFPPLLGFHGVHAAIEATLPLAVAAAVNGITVLRAFFGLFAGTAAHIGEPDLTALERYAVFVAGAAMVLGGL